MPSPESIRTKIATALLARLDLVSSLNSKTFDTVRLKSSDFADWEIPAVQIIDLAELVTHEGRRARKDWNLLLEVIVGPNGTDAVDQKTLWNLMQEIEETIWAVPNFGVPGVIHAKLLTTSTDLHLLKPFYLGRIELSVAYYQPLVGAC